MMESFASGSDSRHMVESQRIEICAVWTHERLPGDVGATPRPWLHVCDRVRGWRGTPRPLWLLHALLPWTLTPDSNEVLFVELLTQVFFLCVSLSTIERGDLLGRKTSFVLVVHHLLPNFRGQEMCST
jgi:hypothetical protein